LQVGSNIQHEIEQKRAGSNHSIQPYIMAVGHPRCIGKMYLVWGDSHSMELSRSATPLRAIDLWFKAHYVLHCPPVLGWKNVFRFLEVHLFGITPENPRLSLFMEKYLELQSVLTC
jgi:hypothetical protein